MLRAPLVLAILMASNKRMKVDGMALDALKVQQGVSTYYGETLSSSSDLKT